MPKQINTPKPGSALVQRFALKGRYQPVLDEVIVPVTIVNTDEPSNRREFVWGTSSGASGVGNQNFGALVNPVGSGVLVVLRRVTAISGSVGDVVELTFEDGGSGAAGSPSRDSRISEGSVAQVTSTAAGAIVLGFPHYLADGRFIDLNMICKPGVFIKIIQQATNATLQVNLEWYEVPLSSGTEL